MLFLPSHPFTSVKKQCFYYYFMQTCKVWCYVTMKENACVGKDAVFTQPSEKKQQHNATVLKKKLNFCANLRNEYEFPAVTVEKGKAEQ